MNAKSSICLTLTLFAMATVQPCWAQLIDPSTEMRAPVSVPGRRAFDLRKPGMSPEVIRPGAIDAPRRAELRRMSPTVLEQIGQVKESMPRHLGVR